MLLAILAAVLHAYAPTYNEAAAQAVSFQSRVAHIVNANREGRFAVVLTNGGVMEGDAFTAPIYLEHFSFGWQPVLAVGDTCAIVAIRERAGGAVEQDLMRGMPPVERFAKCQDKFRDVGPAHDVESVRRLMPGRFVPYVIVSRDWAFGESYGPGAGNTLLQRSAAGWHVVKSAGGVMDFNYVLRHGVPRVDACRFRLAYAPPACL